MTLYFCITLGILVSILLWLSYQLGVYDGRLEELRRGREKMKRLFEEWRKSNERMARLK